MISRRALLCAGAAAAAGEAGAPVQARALRDVVGRRLAPWHPGSLDIHHLSTGRGDAILIVGPDGTTFLVDAGAASRVTEATLPARPNASRRPGEWIARYVRRRLAETGGDGIDTLLVTHLHPDHTGGVTEASPKAASGRYRLTGVSEVEALVPVGRLIDPYFPTYGFPPFEDAAAAGNYVAFVRDRVSRGGVVEPFRVGARDQLRLSRGGSRLPFEVRNLAARGVVWTGRGDVTTALFPQTAAAAWDGAPSENACSAALRLRFGRFDYFCGGDLTDWADGGARAWMDALTPAAVASGRVDAAVAPHHGLHDASGAPFVKALAAQVWVVSAWHASHPGLSTLDRLFNERLFVGPRSVYVTGMSPTAAVAGDRLTSRLASREGHVVLRVASDGAAFRVIVTSDRDEDDRVTTASDQIVCL